MRLGDIIRQSTSTGIVVHFTTFIFEDDDGRPWVFSKSGERGKYHMAPAEKFEGVFESPEFGRVDYGSIDLYYRPR